MGLITGTAPAGFTPQALAQQAAPAPKAGKPINAGDVLSGELNALRVRGAPVRLTKARTTSAA